MKNKNNKRILGFGRFAGIVGTYNSFLSYGLKSGKYNLKAAHKCEGRTEVEKELKKIKLQDEKIILTGNGRVANGALEAPMGANASPGNNTKMASNPV